MVKAHQTILRVWHVQWIEGLIRKWKRRVQLGVVDWTALFIQIGLPLPQLINRNSYGRSLNLSSLPDNHDEEWMVDTHPHAWGYEILIVIVGQGSLHSIFSLFTDYSICCRESRHRGKSKSWVQGSQTRGRWRLDKYDLQSTWSRWWYWKTICSKRLKP